MKWRAPRRPVRNILLLAATTALLATGCGPQYVVLNPVGPAGITEYRLIVLSTILVLIVIIPVMILLAFIVIRYRDKPGNTAPYKPNWDDNRVMEVVWWGVPIVIIGILGTITAQKTFALQRPPEQNVAPITIQVTSLDWKWLFQYPGQGIATVNYCEIPTGVPVQFELTADAPMNSFWVPQLGGQEYAMPGMAMRLWLQADKVGTYYGHGANFTGKGFAYDTFHVIAASNTDFQQWVQQVKQTAPILTRTGYAALVKPGLTGQQQYSSFPTGLFNDTVWANGGKYHHMGNMAGGGDMTRTGGTSMGSTMNMSSSQQQP